MTYDMPVTEAAGPLQQWFFRVQQERLLRPRRIRVHRGASPAGQCEAIWPKPSPGPSKRLFLVELECCGDMLAAAGKAGCTLADVRAWRADPKFDRDLFYAAAGYLRTLERMLAEAAAALPEDRAADVRALLDAKSAFIGADGRLDAAAWRNALRDSAAQLRLDPSSWEPREP